MYDGPDQTVWINTSVWTLQGVSGLFLSLRLFCKLHRTGRIWWDDFWVSLAWLLLLASTIIGTINNGLGFGKHFHDIPADDLPLIIYYARWGGSMSILAAVLSKTSFAVTLLRFMEGHMRMLLWAIIISMNIAMDLNAIFGWVNCMPVQKGWLPDVPGVCWAPEAYADYGIFAGAYSAAMDFVLAALPWKMVWKLKMETREKIGVALALSLGVFAGVTAVVKTALIPTIAGEDFTYDSAKLVVWGTAEAAVTIIATCIPALRSLLLEFKGKARHTVSTDAWTHKKTRTGQSTVTVTADRTLFERSNMSDPNQKQDDRSDKHILSARDDWRIVRTREIAIEYEDRVPDSESGDYELETV